MTSMLISRTTFRRGPIFTFSMRLTPEASEKVGKGKYERLFNQVRFKVRAWETAQGI